MVWNSHQKWKKQIFIRKFEFFDEKIFFDHFSNVHHSYTTFLDCYKVIHVANAVFIKDFFKISPGESKTWKKDFSATKSNKSTIWMLECRNWIPKLVYPLAWMGFSFSTLAFKLWICLILLRTCLPQIRIFGGIAKCNNSVSFTDRSTNFSPISLKNYFLNFEKNIFWNFWFFWDFFFRTDFIFGHEM